MPIFKSGKGLAPSWCELKFFEIIDVVPGMVCALSRAGIKERLIVGAGDCIAEIKGAKYELKEGRVFDLPNSARRVGLTCGRDRAKLIRLSGCWGDVAGTCGVFSLEASDEPDNHGDPTPVLRNTRFDNHYHDFDEYWIVFGGMGEIVTEGNRYAVSEGYCVATGKGHHHDFPWVNDTIRGVWFEGTLEGACRTGHLWEHTHGIAQPKVTRI